MIQLEKIKWIIKLNGSQDPRDIAGQTKVVINEQVSGTGKHKLLSHQCIFVNILKGRRQYSGQHSRYPLVTFLSLVLPLSGQRLSKIAAIHCPQTGLAMLYAFEAVASNSLSLSTSEKTWKSRRDYKKSKPEPLTGGGRLSKASIKAYWRHRYMMQKKILKPSFVFARSWIHWKMSWKRMSDACCSVRKNA